MKIKFLSLILGALAVAGFTSCSDDDDNDLSINEVPVAYQNALQAKYPDVVKVKWERKADYYVADFTREGNDYDVWFGSEAQWAMTEVDYGKGLMQLPPAVSSAYSESQYAYTCVIEDVTGYERPDKTFYVIEVEPTSGGADSYLYYNTDGTILKIITQDVDITPTTPV